MTSQASTESTEPRLTVDRDAGPPSPIRRIAVTGATGFIGRRLVAELRQRGASVLPLSRRQTSADGEVVVDLGEPEGLARALKGVDAVIHCAGYAHAHEEFSSDADQSHQLVNCEYVINTARAAAKAGVRRFVFCSSVKAVGDPGDRCVDESFKAPPDTSYGRAKRAAEEGLAEIGAATGLETVVLRFAMVYGPGSRGNLERMLQGVARRRFPPLPETGNKRSMVHVSDVVSAVILAAQHTDAAGRTFIVAHPHAFSGRALYQAMRAAWSLPPSRGAVPASLLRAAGRSGDFLGNLLKRRLPLDSQTVNRLLDSAWYSPAALQNDLGWTAQIDLDEGLSSLSSSDRSPDARLKRLSDVVLGVFAACVLIVPSALVALLIRATSTGPALYWSDRVGKDNALFKMPKFRTMHTGTPALATHLLVDADRHITPIGRFLRKTSLDELPQLWSVLTGDMSFVGPRPALFNQYDLIALRTECGVHRLRPGITGWAQVNGRDELSIEEKIKFDRQYLERCDLAFDLRILIETVRQVVKRRGIKH